MWLLLSTLFIASAIFGCEDKCTNGCQPLADLFMSSPPPLELNVTINGTQCAPQIWCPGAWPMLYAYMNDTAEPSNTILQSTIEMLPPQNQTEDLEMVSLCGVTCIDGILYATKVPGQLFYDNTEGLLQQYNGNFSNIKWQLEGVSCFNQSWTSL